MDWKIKINEIELVMQFLNETTPLPMPMPIPMP